jgi:hypothetical protein
MAGEWIEVRGIVLRADGEAVIVTRGAAQVMPIATAVRALDGQGLALWLAGLTWRPRQGLPSLRRLRLLEAGSGTWDAARAAFLERWRAIQPARRPRLRRQAAAQHDEGTNGGGEFDDFQR